MLCDKSSKTLKCHHSALKKEVIRCANSQVSLRQLYNNISGPRQPGSTLSPWRRNTGFPLPAPQSQVHLKLLWKSQYWISSLKELGLVQFSEKATPVCRAGFNSYRSRRLRDLHKVNYRKHGVDRNQNGKIAGRARRLPATQLSLWFGISNCTIIISKWQLHNCHSLVLIKVHFPRKSSSLPGQCLTHWWEVNFAFS